MRQGTNVHSTKILTLFGGGYVPERRADGNALESCGA
jgi:hypothetical protein